MANQIRIKRRASTGSAGAPSSLKNAELAFNEADNILYYGYGDDGGGNATSIIGIAGDGSVVSLTGNQTVAGDKTFTGSTDLTGGFELSGVSVTATASELNILDGATLTTVELNYLDGVTSAVQTQINAVTTDISENRSAIGISDGDTDLGTFSGSTIQDNRSVKEALQDLETELEDGGGSLTADDAGTADFASGTVTVSGGTGLSSTASLNTLTLNLDNTTVTGGSYGSASAVPSYTVDAQGRLTAASNVTIDIVHTQVSDFDAGVQANTLDSLAQPTAAVAMNSQKITGLADPTNDQDAATKAYVDATSSGLDVKESVRAATTANITLSNTQTIDGVALVAGDRVLVKNQTTASENGIYDVVSGGAWTRSSDADANDEVNSGLFTFVEEGSANGNAGFVLTTDNPITLDTTALEFAQFSGAGQITAGAGMTKSGNTLDVVGNAGRIVVNANDVDLATHGTAGVYNGLTVDAYGRVSSFSQPTTLAGYGITDAQGLDATLTALAGLSTSANQLIYATGSDAFALSSLSAYGRSLIDDADAATARTTLGLGTIATQDANNVSITGGTIDGCSIDGGTF